MNAPESARHLTPAALLEHWNSDVPVLIPLSGTPDLTLRIDKPRERLTLRAPVAAHSEAPRNALAHVRLDVVVDEGRRFLEVSTTDARLVLDGYAMLSVMADRIQLDGAEPIRAVDETLETWRAMLAARARISQMAEIGLFGELLIVEAVLAGGLDPRAWHGGLREEHDFALGDAHLEAKTTSGERRLHWISGLTQLVPTGETPLWLLSIQITRSGTGPGRTLPQLVQSVLDAISEPELEHHVRDVLAGAGWQADDADLFSSSWRLRTPPLALAVDDNFPRITPAHLTAAGVDLVAIHDLTYEIDVSDRAPSSDLTPALATVLEYFSHTSE